MATIDRKLLPQIPSDQLENFIQYLKDSGIKFLDTMIPMRSLKPIQKHVNRKKVLDIVARVRNGDKQVFQTPIIVTTSGFIVDGHHRWVAAAVLRMNDIPAIQVQSDLSTIIKMAHDFEGSFTKEIHEWSFGAATQLLKEGVIENINGTPPQILPVDLTMRLYTGLNIQRHSISDKTFNHGMNIELQSIADIQQLTQKTLLHVIALVVAHLKVDPNYYSHQTEYASDGEGDDVISPGFGAFTS